LRKYWIILPFTLSLHDVFDETGYGDEHPIVFVWRFANRDVIFRIRADRFTARDPGIRAGRIDHVHTSIRPICFIESVRLDIGKRPVPVVQ
jgi:hypothetical protein